MIDTVIIGEKSSYDDFDASMKERTIHKPKKKSLKETVPFSNVAYDFSAIDGEVYWEERTLDYVFEIMADSPESLEQKKASFASWIMNVMEEELHDPFIKDFHFKATYEDMQEDDEDNVEKTTIKVSFKAYPYMIADQVKMAMATFEADTETELVIQNNSSHRITPTIETDVAVVVTKGDSSYGIPVGTTTDHSFKFEPGFTVLKISSSSAGTISFTFAEEIF